MTLQAALMRLVVLLGAFALGTAAVAPGVAAAQTPSPALVITVRGEHALAIADPLTRKVVASVPISGGGFPHEVAVSEDGKLAFVTVNSEESHGGYGGNFDPKIPGDFIAVIDLAAQKVLRRVPLGRGALPHGIVVVGGKVYFTAQGFRLVGRYDPVSNQVDWMMGTGQSREHMLVVTRDAKRIFTADTFSNSVAAIVPWDSPADFVPASSEPPPPDTVTIIRGLEGPEGIAMSPDEKEVWVGTRGNGTLNSEGGIAIIDVATTKILQTFKVTIQNPIRMKFTPDGKRVLVADDFSGDVLAIDALTRKEIKRIIVGKPLPGLQVVNGLTMVNGVEKKKISNKMHGLMVAPNGSHAYVGLMGSDRIVVVDLKTLEVVGNISTGDAPEAVAWAETR